MPRQTLWVDTLLSFNTATAGQTITPLGPAGLSTVERRLERLTLIRTIVRIDLAAAVRDAGEGDNIVDYGIEVVSEESRAAGTVPDPSTEVDFPTRGWVWRARYRVYQSSVDDQNVDIVRIDKDLHGKRLIENGRLIMVTDNTANQGTAVTTQTTGIVRCLFLAS